MSETTDALKVVVASEHAALFTYGVITLGVILLMFSLGIEFSLPKLIIGYTYPSVFDHEALTFVSL